MLNNTLAKTCVLVLAIAGSVGVLATSLLAQTSSEVEMSGLSGSPDAPRHHFRLRNPAELDAAEAERIYRIVKPALAIGYAASGLAETQNYQEWRKYNSAPYLSSTHGNHYINNYANETGRAYARFEKAGRLPVGSVLVKDSFSVTETGGILLGPVFVMEKMPAGFNDITGDWKYKLVQPDGRFLGETNGEGAKRVEYCIACHWAVEKQDHLYFIPEDYRAAGE